MFLFRLLKWMLGTVVLGAVLAAALIGGYFYLDRLAKTAIERGGARAMGVPTTVESANLSLRKSELALHRLRIENPEGFTAPHFLELENGRVGLRVRTLWRDPIVVPQLHLEGIVMHLEDRAGGSNYEILLESIEELRESIRRHPTPEKTYVIQEIVMREVTVYAGTRRLAFLRPLRITVEEIRLEDVGTAGGEGLVMGQLQGVLVRAILQAIAREAGELLSGAAVSQLESSPGPTVRGLAIEGLSVRDLLNAPLEGIDSLLRRRERRDTP